MIYQWLKITGNLPLLTPVGLEAEGSTVLYEQNPFQPNFSSLNLRKCGYGDIGYGVAERELLYPER